MCNRGGLAGEIFPLAAARADGFITPSLVRLRQCQRRRDGKNLSEREAPRARVGHRPPPGRHATASSEHLGSRSANDEVAMEAQTLASLELAAGREMIRDPREVFDLGGRTFDWINK